MKLKKLPPDQDRESGDGYQKYDTIETIITVKGKEVVGEQDIPVGDPIYELMEIEKKEKIQALLDDVNNNLDLISQLK